MSAPGSGPEAAGAALPVFEHANAQFVTDRLAVGGDLSANFQEAKQELDELVAAGITHIADLRAEWSDETLVRSWAPQLHYLHHRVEDAGQLIDPKWFEDLVGWVRGALSHPNTKVLLHCHMGVNRAPSAALAVLLDQGVGLRDALDRIRDVREVAVIDYASSVLTWYFERTGADTRARRNARRVLSRWRESHRIDPEEVIRQIRLSESGSNRWVVRLGPADPGTLSRVLAESGEVAVGLTVHQAPPELAQLDEVLFLSASGLCGRALVVGPVQVIESGAKLLPVMITDLFEALPIKVPERVATWRKEHGPNPLLLTRQEYLAMTSRTNVKAK